MPKSNILKNFYVRFDIKFCFPVTEIKNKYTVLLLRIEQSQMVWIITWHSYSKVTKKYMFEWQSVYLALFLKISGQFYPLKLLMWHFAKIILFIKLVFCNGFKSSPVILRVLYQNKYFSNQWFWRLLKVNLLFFLFGFSLMNIHESQDSRGRGGYFFL